MSVTSFHMFQVTIVVTGVTILQLANKDFEMRAIEETQR